MVGYVIALLVLIVLARAVTYVGTLGQRTDAVGRWASSREMSLREIRPLWGRSFFSPTWSVYFAIDIEGRSPFVVTVAGPISGYGVTEL